MIDRIVSNLGHIIYQIEVIGFIMFVAGILILLACGAWLIIDGIRRELNGD